MSFATRRVAAAAVLCFVCHAVQAEWVIDTQPIMGTRVHVEVWHEDTAAGRAAVAAVMAEMRRIDELMSPFRETSELSALNREAARQPVKVSPDLLAVLQHARAMSELTGGAFDVTFASAGRYYDYRKRIRPDDATLARAVEAIDYRYVEIDAARHTVSYRHPGVYVDLGGIAKGYAVDLGIALLEARGIDQAMVGAGGDSRIIGDRRGEPWTVGVKDPREPDSIAVVLPLENTAVSTSGDYQRYFEQDGVRYHHIIDPSTGDSARAVRSVTILGPDATRTDGLSTSVFVLGAEKGLALIDRLPEFDAIVIDGEGKLFYSKGLENL